uniref:Catalase n=1 Tax=Penicillium janthinellum TaxID=5079 RepID=CAT1_PENJA|nr:RecName: Full=Catalase [Penicillium janthinellum]
TASGKLQRKFLDRFAISMGRGVALGKTYGTLGAASRGATLLQDLLFTEIIFAFDRERVPERAVHARGTGAHGTFLSYEDWSNLTAASFLSAEGKFTPEMTRFSTVSGARGSADTARDVHGFATRFYVDEGNFDIVGNNIPVFFIWDVIIEPTLMALHAQKPNPRFHLPRGQQDPNRISDNLTARGDSLAQGSQISSERGSPKAYSNTEPNKHRSFRLVTDNGKQFQCSNHWQPLQGFIDLGVEEAWRFPEEGEGYVAENLFESIELLTVGDEELEIQSMSFNNDLRERFNSSEVTKSSVVRLVPLITQGKLVFNKNIQMLFNEVIGAMFQPGHIVRGVDFTEDPLLQGRLFSYLDTQLNRHGPNIQQLGFNRPPRAPIHNNNRDGAGEMIDLPPFASFVETQEWGAKDIKQTAVGQNKFDQEHRFSHWKFGVNGFVHTRNDDNVTHARGFFTAPERGQQKKRVAAFDRMFTVVGLSVDGQQANSDQYADFDAAAGKKVAKAIGVEAPKPNSNYFHPTDVFGEHIAASGTKYGVPEGNTKGVLLASVNKPASIAQGAKLQVVASSGDFAEFFISAKQLNMREVTQGIIPLVPVLKLAKLDLGKTFRFQLMQVGNIEELERFGFDLPDLTDKQVDLSAMGMFETTFRPTSRAAQFEQGKTKLVKGLQGKNAFMDRALKQPSNNREKIQRFADRFAVQD